MQTVVKCCDIVPHRMLAAEGSHGMLPVAHTACLLHEEIHLASPVGMARAPVRRLGPRLLRVRALQSLRTGCEATSRVCRGGWWSNRAVRLPRAA